MHRVDAYTQILHFYEDIVLSKVNLKDIVEIKQFKKLEEFENNLYSSNRNCVMNVFKEINQKINKIFETKTF